MQLPSATEAEKAARKEAIMYGEHTRGFIDERGRFLDRAKAHQYALDFGLIDPKAPAYAFTHPELISEWLRKYGLVPAAVGTVAAGASALPQQDERAM